MTTCSTKKERLRLALLVDGDNVSAYFAEELITKVALHGDVTIREVFGDFSAAESNPWNSPTSQAFDLLPVHIDSGQTGDNSTDFALIARARALSKDAAVDGICVASSDGDFACLAEVLQEADQLFLVAAPSLASRKLLDACNVLIALDGDRQPPNSTSLSCRELMLLTNAVEMHKNKEGWAKLSAVNEYLDCHSPTFAKSKWGYGTMRKLLKALGCFEVARYRGGAMRTRRKRLPRLKGVANKQTSEINNAQRDTPL